MVTSDVLARMVQSWLFGGHGGDAGLQRWWLFGSHGDDDIGNGGLVAMTTMVVMTFSEVSVKMPCDLCHKVSAEASIFYRCLQGPGLVNLPALATKLGRFTKANVPAKPRLVIF